MFNKIFNGLGLKGDSNKNYRYLNLMFKKLYNIKSKLNFLKKKKFNTKQNSNPELTKYFPFMVCAGLLLLNSKNRKYNFNDHNNIFKSLGLDLPLLHCYKVNNKEIEKMMGLLENQIKNLEFRYQGKLRRQPIK